MQNQEKISSIQKSMILWQKAKEGFSSSTAIGQPKEVNPCPVCGQKPVVAKFLHENPFDKDFFEIRYTCQHEDNLEAKIKEGARQIAAIQRADKLYNQCNLGLHFKEKTFQNYDWNREPQAYQSCLKYARGFPKYARGGRGLILYSGGPGNGKTHLAGAIMHEAIERHLSSSLFVRGADMVADVQNAKWGRKSEFSVKTYQNVDLLVIDDLAKEGVTAATAKVYWLIVDYRVLNNKPIIITTNFDDQGLLSACEDEVAVDTWDKVLSRIEGSCSTVEFVGGDYRRQVLAKAA